ncbi:hypothetical protein DS837_30260 [Azospirillum brasilense]|uniref:Uncharacterized protein n=1 Tax=Azospirillum brasilense TaxID=192 RepID=A0A6L3ARB9_AZOBR|nr:hypothetical protein DS837_30260 [Azospirillum brasilense]
MPFSPSPAPGEGGARAKRGRVRVPPRISALILGFTLTHPLRGHPLPGRERESHFASPAPRGHP